jgi:hypothetical protein
VSGFKDIKKSKSPPREIMFIQSFREAETVIRQRKAKATGQLVVRIPEVSVDQSLRWERDLNEAFQECGCRLGTQCGMLAFCGIAAWGCFQFSDPGFTWFAFLRELLIGVFLACALGRALGLSFAKIRIARIARDIKQCEGRITSQNCHSVTRPKLVEAGK